MYVCMYMYLDTLYIYVVYIKLHTRLIDLLASILCCIVLWYLEYESFVQDCWHISLVKVFEIIRKNATK